MDPASPITAGTGQETTDDAPGVADTGGTFERDWKFAPTADAPGVLADGRGYRGLGHPPATGDGRP